MNLIPSDGVYLPLPSNPSSEFEIANCEMDSEDPTAARKLQKAGREKQRRCRLNEQFIELGNTLDADRPKNDKATILTDTIQMLTDLTAEVNKLQAEYAALSEEARELTQEKNDLREEKATLKSDIDRLNVQCQQRVGSTYPWVAMDSVLPHPSSYAYHMPIPVASAPSYPPMPMHIPMQPYSFFGSANPGMFANPCSTFVPYMAPNPPAEQPSTQEVSPSTQPGSRTQVSAKQGVGTSSDRQERRSSKKEDSDDVPTNLELKTPGSTTDEDMETNRKKLVQEKSIAAEGSSSRCSSHSVQDSSSSSIVGGGKNIN
ncbi:unnamed protein product [Amaranthus hypochondriacus]